MQHNVLEMSGKAVEASRDEHTLLLDKTGTINRHPAASCKTGTSSMYRHPIPAPTWSGTGSAGHGRSFALYACRGSTRIKPVDSGTHERSEVALKQENKSEQPQTPHQSPRWRKRSCAGGILLGLVLTQEPPRYSGLFHRPGRSHGGSCRCTRGECYQCHSAWNSVMPSRVPSAPCPHSIFWSCGRSCRPRIASRTHNPC